MLIPILIFAVLSIALIFFLIKSAETWNWIPITFVALIFLTSIFGGISASRSLKMRRAWKAQYLSNEDALARAQTEFDEALYGASNTVSGYGEGSLRDAALRLRLAQIGKGRVWSNGSPSRNGEQFTLKYTSESGVTPADQVAQDMQLFAFESSDRVVDPGGGAPPAADFVGSFKIVSIDATSESITLESVFMTKFYNTGSLMRQLSAELATNSNADKINRLYIELEIELDGDLQTEFLAAWQDGETSGDMSAVGAWLDDKATGYEPIHNWTLFEKMPGDSRNAFINHAGLEPFSDANPATPEKLAALRELLTTVYLPAELVGLVAESAEYEELIDQYNFDGAKVNEINQFINQTAGSRVNDRFTMLSNDEHIYGLVKFNKQSEPFVVDGTGRLDTDGPFDLNGGAINPDIKHGSDISFAKDVEVMMPKGPAIDGNPINAQEKTPSIVSIHDADWLEVEYFKRPLRDYPYQLREYKELTRKASNNRRAIESDIESTLIIQGDTTAQISSRTIITANLNDDIKAMKEALAEINRLHELRAAELAANKEKIRTLYNQIIETYRQPDPSADFLDTSTNRPDGSLVETSR